jgi:predicted neuraminidase
MTLRLLLPIALALLALTAACGAAPFYHAEPIFPAEHFHNHASCLVELPNGDLLACWYRGVGPEKGDDVRIYGARRLKGARAWSPRFVLADTPGYPDDNPCLFVDPQQRLWLLWPTLVGNEWHTALMKYRISSNYQMRQGPPVWSWQDVIHVTPANFQQDVEQAISQTLAAHPDLGERLKALYGDELGLVRQRATSKVSYRLGWMTRAHPTLLPSGRLLVPLYTDGFSVSIIAITDDLGRTWKTSRVIAGEGGIQPSVVRKQDGTLVAMMRTAGPHRRILLSHSRDEGMTWSPVTVSDLPNPGSGLEVIRIANGHWVLVYNDREQGREDLAVSISDDEGQTWKWTRHLEKGSNGSYPSIIQTRDGMLHATYSHSVGAQTIKYAAFNEEWVRQGDPKE